MEHLLLGCFTAAALLGSSAGYSQIVIQHLGAADPVTEGFSLVPPGNGELGPVFGDQGLDAWSIAVLGGNVNGIYRYVLSPLEQQLAKSQGWVLSTRVRLVGTPEVSYSFFGLGTEGGTITLGLTLDANGDPAVEHSFLGEHAIPNGEGQYHEFSLVYDPIEAMVSLWIEGVKRSSMPRTSESPAPTRIEFGAGQTSGLTHAHWNEVTFAIVPEPATFALLAGLGALLVAGGVRWRKRGLGSASL